MRTFDKVRAKTRLRVGSERGPGGIGVVDTYVEPGTIGTVLLVSAGNSIVVQWPGNRSSHVGRRRVEVVG